MATAEGGSRKSVGQRTKGMQQAMSSGAQKFRKQIGNAGEIFQRPNRNMNQARPSGRQSAGPDQQEPAMLNFDPCVCPCISVMLMMTVVIVVLDVVVFVGISNISDDIKDSEGFPGDKADAFLIQQQLLYLHRLAQMMIPSTDIKMREKRMADSSGDGMTDHDLLVDIQSTIAEYFAPGNNLTEQINSLLGNINNADSKVKDLMSQQEELTKPLAEIVKTQKKIIDQQTKLR